MTSLSNLFSSYFLCSGNQYIKVVDGSLSSVARRVYSYLKEHDVSFLFFMQFLTFLAIYCLVAILLRILIALLILFPSYYEFHDLSLGKRTSNDRRVGGLYKFEEQAK